MKKIQFKIIEGISKDALAFMGGLVIGAIVKNLFF